MRAKTGIVFALLLRDGYAVWLRWLRFSRMSEGIWRVDAEMFSRRWVSEEVPGMRSMLGERWRSQARATTIGEVWRAVAASLRTVDWSGVKPPRGK